MKHIHIKIILIYQIKLKILIRIYEILEPEIGQTKWDPKLGKDNEVYKREQFVTLNVVLETKKGNPISLCVIYLLIARKLKLPVFGVNLPNMFMLLFRNEQQEFYINRSEEHTSELQSH